jgi:beta-lactamase regulating signal transducer with metallopeptidase domain
MGASLGSCWFKNEVDPMSTLRELLISSILLILGVIDVFILKYTSIINFIEDHPNFDINLMLPISLFLEFLLTLLAL